MGDFTLNSAHNFGIYTKSGKRTIFQIDFSDKKVSLIERGKISKSYDFQNLEQYDSEDNLHIVIRFRGNKSLEFDADTAEEKYTICRLLGMIFNPDSPEVNGEVESRGENGIHSRLSTKKQVIKEGILDKKGNTKIPTWSRRRLQVCPGEFSYYKPGDEVALNLVQLWENDTVVGKNGQSGFYVSVRDRSYQFRLNSEKGVNLEEERTKWIMAFQQASQRKRATFLLLEMTKQQNVQQRQGMPLPSLPGYGDDDYLNNYYNSNLNRSTGSSGSNSSREILEGLEAINELDEVLNDETVSGGQRNIALSVVQKNSPVLATPTKHRARPPAISNMKPNSFKADEGTYDFIPEPDYSPPQSPLTPPAHAHANGSDDLTREKQASGVYKRRISQGDVDGSLDTSRDSEVYTRVIKTGQSPLVQPLRQSGDYTRTIPAPGAVNVMSNFTEFPKLKHVASKDKSFEKSFDRSFDSDHSRARSPSSPVSPGSGGEGHGDLRNAKPPKIKQKEKRHGQVIQVNGVKDKSYDNSDKALSPKNKSKFPAPAPSGPRLAPPPPAPLSLALSAPVPPPPLIHRAAKGNLKQVHWNKTPKPMVANSIWERPHDMSTRLNVKLLEEQFSLKERDVAQTPTLKTPVSTKPQLLVDSKRAQILDIFMSGLKNEGAGKLVDVLNSVTEDDSFPAEKLTTIKRYQPTEDEIDMYLAHAHRKHELHPVDQFMLELCEIPCLSVRIDICMTLWEFPWQYESTCQLVDQVYAACDELLNSQMLVLVLEYILAIGNHLNRNWSEHNVTPGFQVTSLDKVLSVRGKDSGYTLVHFLVEQLRQTDPGLLQWIETVQTVKKCEQVSVKSVAAESDVLKGDLSKVKKHLKTLKSQSHYQNRQDNKFQQDAQNLTVEYEMKLDKMDRRCSELQNKYRKILTRFGEPLYQRSDQMFAVIGNFVDKFKTAVKDLDKGLERKLST